MDPLSEVLRSVRLTGGVFLDARFTEPWCVTSEITAQDCRPHLARPAQLIGYHVVLAGKFLLFIGGKFLMEVSAGEIVLLPRNEIHVLASAPGLDPVDGQSLIQTSPGGGIARVRYGGSGEETNIVCGFLGSDEMRNPLLSTLPAALKLDIREGTKREWIEASVQYAASELVAGRLASSDLISRLSEVLLIEAVRHYAATLGPERLGWLKGLSDPHVGRALAMIHRDIGADFSTETLAKEAGLSRSGFMDRFTALVGMPPIRYLTVWRLETAKVRLRETRETISRLAHALGYESEEAFSRAFKREFGISPARWRDHPAES